MLAPTFYQISYPAYNKTNMLRVAVLCTVYPKKYAHGFVVLCFVVVTQSFIMNSHEVFIHIHQGCFAGTGAIVRLPQCQWSKPDGYGKISQCITTTKQSKNRVHISWDILYVSTRGTQYPIDTRSIPCLWFISLLVLSTWFGLVVALWRHIELMIKSGVVSIMRYRLLVNKLVYPNW